MNTRDEYVAKAQAKLDQWNAQIDELEARARQAKAQEVQKHQERIADLKRKRDEAQQKLEEIQGAGEDAWGSLKSGAEELWQDLTTTLQESKNAFFEGLQADE